MHSIWYIAAAALLIPTAILAYAAMTEPGGVILIAAAVVSSIPGIICASVGQVLHLLSEIRTEQMLARHELSRLANDAERMLRD